MIRDPTGMENVGGGQLGFRQTRVTMYPTVFGGLLQRVPCALLLPSQNPSVKFSSICSSLHCLLGRIPAFPHELHTPTSPQHALSQYLPKKMRFWKTLVVQLSYEWLLREENCRLKRLLEIISKLCHFTDGKTKVQRSHVKKATMLC